MKTISHFHTPVKRHHTISSDHNTHLSSPAQNKLRRLRIRTVTSMTENHKQKTAENLRSYAQDSLIDIKLDLKTPRPIDRYDEQSENLTAQFSAEWSKMSSMKRQTYSKLRNKFVRKFPSFRQKYKQQQIDQIPEPVVAQPEIYQTKFKTQNSISKPTIALSIRSSLSKVKPIDPMKKAYFYSRSKKKCLQNSVQVEQIKEHMKEVPIPKISYVTYVKNLKQRKKLFVKNKVKGNNMIKSRDKILCLQKQGTRSYHSLKRCLQDAIQTCIRSK